MTSPILQPQPIKQAWFWYLSNCVWTVKRGASILSCITDQQDATGNGQPFTIKFRSLEKVCGGRFSLTNQHMLTDFLHLSQCLRWVDVWRKSIIWFGSGAFLIDLILKARKKTFRPVLRVGGRSARRYCHHHDGEKTFKFACRRLTCGVMTTWCFCGHMLWCSLWTDRPLLSRNGLCGAAVGDVDPAGPAAPWGGLSSQRPRAGSGVWGRHPAAAARSHGAAGHRPAEGGVPGAPGHQHRRAAEHPGYGCLLPPKMTMLSVCPFTLLYVHRYSRYTHTQIYKYKYMYMYVCICVYTVYTQFIYVLIVPAWSVCTEVFELTRVVWSDSAVVYTVEL